MSGGLITFRNRDENGEPITDTYWMRFDALTAENYSRSAEITNYPIESGGILSDHYQPQPRSVSLTGQVSNQAVYEFTNIPGKIAAAAPRQRTFRSKRLQITQDPNRVGRLGVPRPVPTGVLPSQRLIRANVERGTQFRARSATLLQVTETASDNPDRISLFFETMDGLIEQRTPVDIILTNGFELINMMVRSLNADRRSGSDMVAFSFEVQQVISADPLGIVEGTPKRSEPEQKPKQTSGRGKKPLPDPVAEDNSDAGRSEELQRAQESGWIQELTQKLAG